MNFHKATLSNGLTVIAELNPDVHSVAMGFFVRTGARDEAAQVNGVSHFLEHMAFKGDDKYTADDINSRQPAFRGYGKGVPMGADLRPREGDGPPTFMVYALRDPIG